MRRALIIAAVISFCLPTRPPAGEEDSQRIRITPLRGNLHLVDHNPVSNLIHVVLAGPDDTILVDTGYAENADELRYQVESLGTGKIKYIINTHSHQDHVSGNAAFPAEIPIIAHANTRKRFSMPYYHLPPPERQGAPTVTFTDTVTLHANGETVILKHVRAGHTDGDITVYFREAGILYVGDLILHGRFSTVDPGRGGDIRGFLQNLEDLIQDYPDGTRYVMAHGPEYSKEEIRAYRHAFAATAPRIEEALRAGRTPEQIVAGEIFKEYGSWLRQMDWVQVVAAESEPAGPPSICEPLTQTILEKGIAGTVEQYRLLRERAPKGYDFSERELNRLGYELLDRGMVEEAIAIFTLNAEAYPDSANAYDSLGEACVRNGDARRGVEYYRKSLELDPDNENARAWLEKLAEQ